jgi:hypothetical protein
LNGLKHGQIQLLNDSTAANNGKLHHDFFAPHWRGKPNPAKRSQEQVISIASAKLYLFCFPNVLLNLSVGGL